MENPWKTISSKVAYRNPWIKIREDKVIRPDGTPGMYGVLETSGRSVFVVALTKENEVYLTGQFRYPTASYSWELPGGSSDSKDFLEDAKRELWEETGVEAIEWEHLGNFCPMNGVTNEVTEVFLARDLKDTGKNKAKEDGIDNIRAVRVEDIIKMIKDGELSDGQTIAALTYFFIRIGLRLD